MISARIHLRRRATLLPDFGRCGRKASSRMATKSIDLTPPEKLFRQCLLDCRKSEMDVSGMENLELRFTGGWVRDKLLGTTSHDIDVALSTMTGWQFGKALQTYMKECGHLYEAEAQSQGFKAEIKNLHKIEANPEKSKHLETITTRMFGIDVDFVNLRKEVYDDKSRNPQMEFGTPEEDALRRDATVNALFYNLDSQEVEDYTQRGLEDMQNHIIRTPLAPYQTFRDDPLRVLRLIRFASRLNYRIDEAALQAMSDKSIHEALRLKISRERVGAEVGKIVAGPDPHSGLMYIYMLDLYTTVFEDPKIHDSQVDTSKCPQVFDGFLRLLSESSPISLLLNPKDDQGLAWMLAAYTPWMSSEAEAVAAARGGLSAANSITKVLSAAIKHREQISSVVQNAVDSRTTRSEVGVLLRNCGPTWKFQVLYAMLCDLALAKFESIDKRYTVLADFIQEQNLEEAASLKPILNGNDIKKALDVQGAGSWLKQALDIVVEWQFANPKATPEDAKKMLVERKHEIVPS